jgi:hypothetical protein
LSSGKFVSNVIKIGRPSHLSFYVALNGLYDRRYDGVAEKGGSCDRIRGKDKEKPQFSFVENLRMIRRRKERERKKRW